MKDLVVLVADKDMEFAVKGILERHIALQTRKISYNITKHVQKDPGVYNDAHNFLRVFIKRYSYALVMLDKEGCGFCGSSEQIAQNIQQNLNRSGWENHSKVVVIDPELEIWIWSDSPEVSRCIGWGNSELKDWLKSEGYILSDLYKPRDPKAVFEAALRIKGKPRSSSIYGKLAEKVSFDRCTDRSFQNLRDILKNWFPDN